jgi:hypothetical protein
MVVWRRSGRYKHEVNGRSRGTTMPYEARCSGLLPPLSAAAFHIWIVGSVQLALAGPGAPFSIARVALRLRWGVRIVLGLMS